MTRLPELENVEDIQGKGSLKRLSANWTRKSRKGVVQVSELKLREHSQVWPTDEEVRENVDGPNLVLLIWRRWISEVGGQ
jgi:hypothetical protein